MNIVRLQPIRGKFVLILRGGKQLGIWMVDSDTGKPGTAVSKNDAIHLLKMKKPLVRPAIVKDEKGKLIEWFTKKELVEIRNERDSTVEVITPLFEEESENTSKEIEEQTEVEKELEILKNQLKD